MAAPLKIAARIEIDGRQAQAGAAAAAEALAGVGSAAASAETKLQALINASVGLHSGPANENIRRWGGLLADEGMSLDRLRAKYNPLFAVIQQYKVAQTEIRTAHTMGALSADEMTAALSRQRQATLASIDAIKGRNRALEDSPAFGGGARSFQTANLAFQAQDIAVTAAMGMHPLMIGLQQGTQIASVVATMERPIAGVAAAFASLLSPISLMTVGLTAGTAAAIQYFTTAEEGAKQTSALFEEQNDVIRRAAAFWGEATPALRGYVDELDRAKQASDAQNAGGIIAGRELEELAVRLDALRDKAVSAFSVLRAQPGTDDTVRELGYAWDEMREKVEAGTATVADFDNAKSVLADAVRSHGSPALIDFSKSVDQVTSAFYRSLAAAQEARTAWFSAVAGGTSVQDIVSRSVFVEDGETLQTDRFVPRDPAVPSRRPLIELDGLPGADKLDKGAASARNAYRDLIKTADDRVQQMKLEAQLAGETGVAADTLRFKLDLLQQSEDKGRSLTDKQVEAINARVAAFRQYAEEAAKATLKANLLFDREQLGRSTFDQQIAAGLRGAGLPVDFDSYEAGLIRTNLQLEYARNLVGDVGGSLASSLREGKDLWESLGDAGVSALEKIADTLLNDVLNSLFQVQGAGGSGGGLLGSLFGSFFGGGTSYFPPAPSASVGLFDRGGYTGPGGVHEPAGVVHRGEVVFSQADVRRHGGPAVVDAIRLGRRGYATGGVVGITPLAPTRLSSPAAAASEGANGGLKELKISVDVTGARGNAEIQEFVRQGVTEGLREYDAALPDRVAYITDNPRRR